MLQLGSSPIQLTSQQNQAIRQQQTMRRHALQCAPGISNKHIVTPPSCNHPLHTLNQENATVQHNPYFKRWNLVSEIPESSNVQDLHRHYDYQLFGKPFVEQVPMSIGANIVGRDHDGSDDGMLVLTSSSGLGRSYMFRGAPSAGGLQHQQHRDMSNWSNLSLQRGPQTQLTISSDRRQTSTITGAPSSGLQQLRNMFSWRNTTMQTPPQAYLNFASAPGCSSVGSGDISVELLRQTQLYYYARGRASLTTGSTSTRLQQHIIRSMYDSSNNLSLQMPHRQAQLDISSGSRNMEDTINYMVNQRKRRNLLTSMDASPYNVVHSEDIRPAKRPWSSWLPQNYSAGSWRQSTRDMESDHYIFNCAAAQTFGQIDLAMTATVIEKISHDLLDDNFNKEPTGAAEEVMVMSTVNSLSNLLQQDPAPTLAGSSEASDATATTIASPLNVPAQGLGAGPDAGSTGGSCSPDRGNNNDNTMLPSKMIVEGMSSEEEQMGEIEMDMAYLEELLRFCP